MKNLTYLILSMISILFLSACKDDLPTIERFVITNKFLENFRVYLSYRNMNELESIKRHAERKGMPPKAVEIIKRADELMREFATIVNEIDKLKVEIIKNAGDGYDETGRVNNLFGQRKVHKIMATENSRGHELQIAMNNLMIYLKKSFPELDQTNFPSLTEDNPKYYQKYFGNATVAEALALLSERQVRIEQYKAEILKYLSTLEY